jgi:hypothetical protein
MICLAQRLGYSLTLLEVTPRRGLELRLAAGDRPRDELTPLDFVDGIKLFAARRRSALDEGERTLLRTRTRSKRTGEHDRRFRLAPKGDQSPAGKKTGPLKFDLDTLQSSAHVTGLECC